MALVGGFVCVCAWIVSAFCECPITYGNGIVRLWFATLFSLHTSFSVIFVFRHLRINSNNACTNAKNNTLRGFAVASIAFRIFYNDSNIESTFPFDSVRHCESCFCRKKVRFFCSSFVIVCNKHIVTYLYASHIIILCKWNRKKHILGESGICHDTRDCNVITGYYCYSYECQLLCKLPKTAFWQKKKAAREFARHRGRGRHMHIKSIVTFVIVYSIFTM